MTVGRQPTKTIEIDGKPYFLALDPSTQAPFWKPRQYPTQEGDPTVPRRERYNDWSKGMGDSRGVFKGAVEYGLGYLGMFGRILPAPVINTIATGHDVAVTCFAVVTAPANRVISFGGRYAKEIDPSAHTVSTTEDFGAGVTVLDCAVFGTSTAIALGDSALFEWRNSSGVYAANTLTGNLRYARAFGLSKTEDGLTGLVRGRTYLWSKCTADDFYGTDGNWGAEYEIGDPSANITQVGPYAGADYVLKEDGVYTFYARSSAANNVLPALAAFQSSENKRWFAKDNRLFICSYAGLYRLFHNGPARVVGFEEAELNEGTMSNVYPTAGVAFGKWNWTAYYDATANTTYIVMEREARDGDATFGSPSTAVCVIDTFTGKCNAMVIPSKVTSTPELWYGRETSVAWIKLTRDGRPAEYSTTATTRVLMAPTDLGNPMTTKYFKGVEGIFRNLAAGRAVTLSAKIDEGSENDIGSALTSATGRRASTYWTLGTNDSGRSIQLIAEMTNDSTTTPPEIRELVLEYEERPSFVAGFEAVLELREANARDEVSTRATAQEQRQALEAILDGAPVTIVDPEGTSYTGAVFNIEGEADYQFGGEIPQQSLRIGVRALSYAD